MSLVRSTDIFLLKMSILLLDDKKLLSQYSLLTKFFSSRGGCTFVIFYVSLKSILSLSSGKDPQALLSVKLFVDVDPRSGFPD